MNRLAMILGLVALIGVAVPGVAAAEEEKDGGSPVAGLYGQLGAVAGIPAFDIPSTQGQQNGWGIDGRVGYALFSHLSLEGQWQWIERYEVTSGFGSSLNTLRTNTFTGNAKVPIFSGPIEPYLLVGIGLMNADISRGPDKNEFALRIGGGSNFFFTDHLGIYGEITFLQPFGSLEDYASVPIAFGGIYRF